MFVKIASVAFVLFMACATNADIAKGVVGLWLSPGLEELAQAYENGDAVNFETVVASLAESQARKSLQKPQSGKAVVELQALPTFEVLRKTTVDKDCKYVLPINDSDPECRILCRFDVDGVGVSACSTLEWNRYEKAFCQDLVLRKNYASIEGRCFDTNGISVAGAQINVNLIRTPVEQEERWMRKKYATLTDKDGKWRIDGLERPSCIQVLMFQCNTNIMSRYDSTVPPYGIQVNAILEGENGVDVGGGITIPNVTARDRAAAERIFAAYKRKTGKEWPRLAPITDYPVSTNNVIYVPDIVLK